MIIGLTGFARHGKDTAGKVLVNEYGFRRLAFADNVKRVVLAIDPLILGPEIDGPTDYPMFEYVERLTELVAREGWDRAKKHPEVRRLLQATGSEAGREILGENVWVNAVEIEIGRGDLYDMDIVITDVRFHNEEQMIHMFGGDVWRITRLNDDGTEYASEVGRDHISERFIPDILLDREIRAHTIDDLRRAVREIMEPK